jgi:hypothetical protein
MALEGRPSSGPKGRQGARRVTWLDPVPRPTRRRTSTGSQDGALFTSLVRSSELHGGFFAPFETRMVVQRIILAPVWLGHHWPLGQYHVVRSALTIVGSCPKRVNRVTLAVGRLFPVLPWKRTSSGPVAMSQRCHKRTFERGPFRRAIANEMARIWGR